HRDTVWLFPCPAYQLHVDGLFYAIGRDHLSAAAYTMASPVADLELERVADCSFSTRPARLVDVPEFHESLACHSLPAHYEEGRLPERPFGDLLDLFHPHSGYGHGCIYRGYRGARHRLVRLRWTALYAHFLR